MSILKLSPTTKNYLWGGTRLVREYGKKQPHGPLAESWEISCHPDGPSVIEGGPGAGMSLPAYIQKAGQHVLGNNCRGLPQFPILVKLIDAKESLSVQVHPDDGYAFTHEGQQGKTEIWYVLDCEEDAFLYIGFRYEVTPDEVRQALQEGTLPKLLHKVPVRPGDTFMIESGTVHAIGAGILLAEVQQSSNVTYRLFDYNRKGPDGKTRPLHVENALDVMHLGPVDPTPYAQYHLADTDYFIVDKVDVVGQVSGLTTRDSFTALLLYRGAGILYNTRQAFTFEQAASFFIEAGTGPFSIIGNCACLAVTVPAGLRQHLEQAVVRPGLSL